MRILVGIALFTFLYSCNSGAKISKAEISELRAEVNYLKSKVDSLEGQLKYRSEIEGLLNHDSLLFTYRRTPCLGSCAVFKFSVYKDGWATYEGKNFVDMIGVYTAQLTQEQVDKINRIFRSSFFYAFRDNYDDSRLDIPAMIIEYHGEQGVKTVVARTEIPHSFRTMAVDLEEMADEITWTPAE